MVAQTEDSATSAPTDRSMPPPMITKVIPMLTTPMTAASRRMVSTLSSRGEPVAGGRRCRRCTGAAARRPGRGCGPARRGPARDRPARRSAPGPPPAVDAVRPGAVAPAGDGVARAAARLGWSRCGRSCGVPSMTRSRTRGSSSASAAASWTTRPRRTTSTRSARPRTSGISLETTTHGDAAVGQGADQRVDLRAGADVDAAGGLVQQQHPAVAQQPAGQHDLLLVAAGQRADLAVDVGRAHVQRVGQLRGGRRSARPARKPPRANRPRLEIVMLR